MLLFSGVYIFLKFENISINARSWNIVTSPHKLWRIHFKCNKLQTKIKYLKNANINKVFYITLNFKHEDSDHKKGMMKGWKG